MAQLEWTAWVKRLWRQRHGRFLLLLLLLLVLAALGLLVSSLNRMSVNIVTGEAITPPANATQTPFPTQSAAIALPPTLRPSAPAATAAPAATKPFPRPTCGPGETELFFADFEDGDTADWLFLTSRDAGYLQSAASEWYLQAEGGNTFLVADSITGAADLNLTSTPPRYAFQVTFRQVTAERADFELWAGSYHALPRALSREYTSPLEPDFNLMWRKIPYVVDDGWHTLRLAIADNWITLHLDGRRIGAFFDPNPATSPGVAIANYGGVNWFDDVLICGLPESAAGENRPVLFVAADAPPNGDGSQLAPLRTIQTAVARAAPGSRVQVAAGVYAENLHITGQDITIAGGYDAQTWAQVGQPGETVLDGGRQDHVLVIDDGAFVHLDNLTITNGFSDCRQGIGGAGIFASGATTQVTVQRSIIRGNEAQSPCGGGGVELLDASMVLLNSWLVDNVAHNGGGLNAYFGSHFVLSHVTMANNRPDGIFIHAAGVMGEAVNSILLDPVVNGRLAQTVQVLTTDPLFVDAATGDYHLRAGSPAIDAGYTLGAPLVDGDGEERPWGTAVDIGADEYHP